MAECPVCKSTIKATPIGSKTVGIQCNCNDNAERYFINSGTVDDTVSEYINKFSKTTRPSAIPGKIIKDTPTIRTAPFLKLKNTFHQKSFLEIFKNKFLKKLRLISN